MAARNPTPPPRINHEVLRGLTKQAVDRWLLETGKVATQTEVRLDRSLESYGLKTLHVDVLSKHVIATVKNETGIDFRVAPDRLRKFARDTIGHYIEGSVVLLWEDLPDKPSTLPSGPVKDDC
jgi:hypothetical protein